MKAKILVAIGAIGSFVASLFGGWNTDTVTLLIFMGIDYITGLLVAGVFHKSTKTATGALESKAGFKGICKKCMILLFVIIGHRLDLLLAVNYFRTGVVIAFIANELISIVENAGLMGLKIPAIITNSIDLLKKKGESNGKN